MGTPGVREAVAGGIGHRIAKIDQRLQRTAYGPSTLWLAAPFVAIGAWLALAGFGQLPLPGRTHAPPWVIGTVGLVFALAGLVLSAHAFRGLLVRRRLADLRRRHPGQPWRSDFPWDPSGIEDRPATRWAASLAASLLLGVFMVPFNWWAWSGGGPWPVLVFVGLGDLIVFAVLLSFLYRLLQHLKYGRTRLSFAQFPYAPGGRLLVGLSPNRFTQLDVTLRFVTEAFVARGTGRHRSVVHESRAAWAERHTVVANPTQREVELDFALPDQPGWVNRLAADPGIQYWELLVEARRPGIDFRTTFPLPVYDADRSVATIGRPRPPLRASARSTRPYLFEAALPVLLGGVLAASWLLAPATVERAARQGLTFLDRAGLTLALQPINGMPGRSPMALQTGPDGRVWLLDKRGLVRAGEDGLERLMDPGRFAEHFGRPKRAWSSLHVTGTDEAWIGSWYGELFHYRNGRWNQLSERGEPLGKRVHAVLAHQGDILLAGSEGLWRWQPGRPGLRSLAGAPDSRYRTLAVDGRGRLLAGAADGLWRRERDGWHRIWSGAAVESLLADVDTIYVGTDDGLFRLDGSGKVVGAELAGLRVTALQRVNGQVWAGTWQAGIMQPSVDGWAALGSAHGLPGDSVSDFVVDRTGQLWIALYGEGVSRAPLSRLARVNTAGNSR